MMNEPVSSIMIKDTYVLGPDDTMDKVREIFTQKRIHHVPIIEGPKLVGLVTTSDLLWLNKTFDEYNSIRVSDVMTTKLAKLEPDAKIGTAAEIFLKNWFHALPVVDKDDNYLGIVTTFDVLRYSYKKEYPGDDFPFL